MLHFARWKIITITASILLAALLCLPNILPKAQQETLAAYGIRPMTLGLDLQGGSNVLLEVDQDDMKEQLQTLAASDIRAALRDAKIAYSNIGRNAEGVSVKISKPEDMAKAKERLNTLLQPQQGGLLSGGVPVNVFTLETLTDGYALKFNEAGLQAKTADAVKQSLVIIERRVNALGTTEPVIQQQGVKRIAVQLPGVENPDQVKDVLGKTAKLTFQLVCNEQPNADNQTPPQDCRAYPMKEQVDAALKAKKAKGNEKPLTEAELKALPQMWVQTSTRATVDGIDLTGARSDFDQNNRPVVSFTFNTKGAVRFANLTRENVNKPFAIILDKVVQSAPNINEPILGGSGQISGSYTTEETGELAIVLKSGALPAKLNIIEERTVGPSLGC